MEQYDYTGNADILENLFDELEGLDYGQQIKLKSHIEKIKSDGVEEKILNYGKWFHAAVFPVIRGWAESMDSLLTIEQDEMGIINAVIKCSHGLEISEGSHSLHMVLMAASHMVIDREGESVLLSLIYDPEKFPC